MQNSGRIFAIGGEPLRSILALSLFLTPICFGASAFANAQEAAQGTAGPAVTATPVVPQQVRYAGKLATRTGETVEAEFRIYAAAEGGDPLWTETQHVTVGEDGSYSVLLGSASSAGLPQTVFAGGAARWLGVSVERIPEQERVLLSSVPYAMKSADAESLAGHAASDFVTQNQFAQLAQSAQAGSPAPAITPFDVTGSGTGGTVPLWIGANTQGISEITQVGSDIGINEATPAATLDVNGTAQFRGTLTLPAIATATSSSSSSSQFLDLAASVWSSTTNTPVSPGFQMFAYPVNNNTANPTAKFYMQYRLGSKVTTLFWVNSEGIIGFAPGQTFPGAVSTTGTVNAGSYDLGGSLFAYGNRNGNSFLGFAGNGSVPSSIDNTADGYEAMTALTGGESNTAVGANALDTIATGNLNTALGAFSGAGYSNLNDSTAIGANAVVSQNDSLVLGQTTDGSPGKTYVNVGVGTSVPASELELSKSASDALGPVLTLTNPAGDGASAAIDFKTYLHQSTMNSPTARILASDDNNYGTDLSFISKTPGGDFNGLQTNMIIFANGQVTIGPSLLSAAQLAVQGSSGTPIGVYGLVNSGTGVLGVSTGNSGTFNHYLYGPFGNATPGVWGDTSASGVAGAAVAGVVGTADNDEAGFFVNDSSEFPTLSAFNNSSGGGVNSSGGGGLFKVFEASTPAGTCGIGDGDLACTGQMKSLVTTGGGARKVETYSVQSPENWIEDFGSGQLKLGVALVKIDPAFAETVSVNASYHVFITPNGDAEALYVINKTATSFEVRESKGGTSSLTFDYRIVAKRRGYEAQRLTDVTERFNAESARAMPHKADGAPRDPNPQRVPLGTPGASGTQGTPRVLPRTRPSALTVGAGHPVPAIHP